MGGAAVNFEVTALKIMVSYPGGVAALVDLKRDMAILVTSGSDWGERTKRLAARVPNLNIFSQGLVERENGSWRITDKGREVLSIHGGTSSRRAADLNDIAWRGRHAGCSPASASRAAKRQRERCDRCREARERARAAF